MSDKFSRTLPEALLEHINNQCDWWEKAMEFVDEQKLDVAMRNGYLNFYRYGQSVAKITWNSRTKKPVASIHKKYLGDGSASYGSHDPDVLFLSANLEEILKKAEGHAGLEKRGCHDIVVKNAKWVVDMEMGLPKLTSRFDIVAAVPGDERIRLVFFEAKHTENNSLRARNEKPVVLEQLAKYERDLKAQRKDILDGYRNAVKTAKNINIRSGSLKVLAALTPEYIEIDVKPRLVVFMPEKESESLRRPLEDEWKKVLKENGAQLIYAKNAKDIALR